MSDQGTRRAIEDAIKIISPWVEYKRVLARVPGVSVGIVHDERVMFAAGYGWADLAKRTRATETTCYRIASISKTMTATAALQLAERGVLQLDDRIQTFLPWFRSRRDPGLARITVRHLLTHLAGIERDGDTAHWQHGRFPTLAQVRDHVQDGIAVFRPLETFKYSNLGYAIVGQVIAAATGTSYEDYVERQIVRRLSLSYTSPALTARIRSRLAVGYGRDVPPAPRRALLPHLETRALAAATGFTSNVLDLCAYLSAQFLGNTALLSDESKREMQRVHWMNKRVDHHYGIGFDLWKVDGVLVVGHGGGFPGFITRIAMDPERKIGVAVLTNALDPLSGTLANGVLAIIYAFLRGGRVQLPRRRTRNLARYQGQFTSRWSDTEIVSTGGRLIAFAPALDRPMDEAVVLQHIRGHEFKITSGSEFGYLGERVVFRFGRAGRLTGLTWGPNHERVVRTPARGTRGGGGPGRP